MVIPVPDHPLRILHLEDSEEDHFLAARVLQRSRIAVETFRRIDTLAEFAAATQSTETFDLILADYRLPGFTALDAWQALQANPSPPPVVLLSGAIGEAAAVDAMHLGIADYLLKEDLVRLPHVIERTLEVHHARLDKERAVAELKASQQRLAELTEHLQTSIEQERAAIAREIHDDIGGALTAVRFDVAWIRRHAHDAEMLRHAEAAADMLMHATEASQRIMLNLRPPVLEEGLVAAIEWLANSFERRTGVRTQFTPHGECSSMDANLQLVAYRTAQEALTNISKHAKATQVTLDLSDDNNVLTLEVRDDGQGIAPSMLAKPRSFGLKGLQERASSVGGWLDISSKPHHGTSIVLSIPLAPARGHLLKEHP